MQIADAADALHMTQKRTILFDLMCVAAGLICITWVVSTYSCQDRKWRHQSRRSWRNFSRLSDWLLTANLLYKSTTSALRKVELSRHLDKEGLKRDMMSEWTVRKWERELAKTFVRLCNLLPRQLTDVWFIDATGPDCSRPVVIELSVCLSVRGCGKSKTKLSIKDWTRSCCWHLYGDCVCASMPGEIDQCSIAYSTATPINSHEIGNSNIRNLTNSADLENYATTTQNLCTRTWALKFHKVDLMMLFSILTPDQNGRAQYKFCKKHYVPYLRKLTW